MNKLSSTSLARLKGVHPDLVRVIKRAADTTAVPFLVVEGLRTMERQKQLKKIGASTILNSRHITGHAVDLVPLIDGKVSWHWPHFRKLAPFIRAAARAEKVPLEWGGDWKRFPDAPHWQLPRNLYK
ncbi:MAG TPA: M15 family metallopeptidase [Magnetospirillum sp.]|nr:M15 family metallopeptidase [Magnetospirillum sp.]